MPIFFMKSPVARPAKRRTVVGVKSFFRMGRERVEMMRGQSTASRSAFGAGEPVPLKDGLSPLSVNSPVSCSLSKTSFLAFVVPMTLSLHQAHALVFAALRACVFSSIWLVKNTIPANMAIKVNPSFIFVWCWSAYFGKTNFLFCCFRSSKTDIPYCTFPGSKVRRAKPWYFKICKPLAHRSPGITKPFADIFRANAFRDVQPFKKFLGRLCSHAFILAQDVCTATNTWRRAAISTW